MQEVPLVAVPSLFICTYFNPELYNCFPSSCLLPYLHSPLTHLPQIILVAQLTLFKNFSVSFPGPGLDEISENSPSLKAGPVSFSSLYPIFYLNIHLPSQVSSRCLDVLSSLKPAPKAGVFNFYSLWLAMTGNTSSLIPCVGHNTMFLVALAPKKYQVLPQWKIFIFYLKLAFFS